MHFFQDSQEELVCSNFKISSIKKLRQADIRFINSRYTRTTDQYFNKTGVCFLEKVKELEEKTFVLQAGVEDREFKLEELKVNQEELQQKLSQIQVNLQNTQKELHEKTGEEMFLLLNISWISLVD